MAHPSVKFAGLALLLITGIAHFPASALELGAADRAAVFTAAGFKPLEDQFVRCEDDVTDSYIPGWIEVADLNQDGSPEAWVRESSTYCYGNTAEAFVLVGKDAQGGWIVLLDEVGVPLERDTQQHGWPDIEVGGPGAGPFPVYRFDGTRYVRAE